MDSSPLPTEDIIDFDDEEEFMTPDSGQRGKRKQTPETGAESEQNKPKKILPPRSDVWSHFTRQETTRDKCNCHYCKKVFACPSKSGTKNLWNHLDICKQYKAWKDGQDPKMSQQVINNAGNLQNAKVSESVFREAVNEMLVIGELPLSFIESMAWRHFCNKVNLYNPHSRRTATRNIVEMYVQRKATLKKWFQANKQRVSLTSDIWVSHVTGDSYMVITAHYVDAYWKLKKLIIGFKYVTDHKGKTIATVLLECLADWGIEKVFCVTVDNATANSNALMRFETSFSSISVDAFVLKGEFFHMRCAGHIINLIVGDGLAELDTSIVAIRNAVSYVRSGTNRQKAFELKVDSGRMTRGSLPLDIKTRWNSTYLMLSRAIIFKAAFDKMESEDKLYNDHFLESEKGKKRIGPPLQTDWRGVGRIVKFLKIFYESTLVVSASTTLNSHKCYGEIVNIATNLQIHRNSFDSELKTKADDMYDKFDKYWDGMKNINKMLIVATVFDPRKKMQFANLCFADLYGEGTPDAKALYDSVYNILVDMFKEYSERYGKDSDEQNSESQSSQSTQDQQADKELGDEEEPGYRSIDKRYNALLNVIGVKQSKDELTSYLKEPVENPVVMLGTEYNPLSWWKLNCGKYPILSEMARDVFAMQVSSVASESAFSTSGRIIDPYRSCLTHYMVEVLMCTEQWMKQDIKDEAKVLTNAQILSDVKFEDKLQKAYSESETPPPLDD